MPDYRRTTSYPPWHSCTLNDARSAPPGFPDRWNGVGTDDSEGVGRDSVPPSWVIRSLRRKGVLTPIFLKGTLTTRSSRRSNCLKERNEDLWARARTRKLPAESTAEIISDYDVTATFFSAKSSHRTPSAGGNVNIGLFSSGQGLSQR